MSEQDSLVLEDACELGCDIDLSGTVIHKKSEYYLWLRYLYLWHACHSMFAKFLTTRFIGVLMDLHHEQSK